MDERELVAILQRALQTHDSLLISYENREGIRSLRRVTPKQIYSSHGMLSLRAFCRLRGEERTFALRRMRIVGKKICPSTGQIPPTKTVPAQRKERDLLHFIGLYAAVFFTCWRIVSAGTICIVLIGAVVDLIETEAHSGYSVTPVVWEKDADTLPPKPPTPTPAPTPAPPVSSAETASSRSAAGSSLPSPPPKPKSWSYRGYTVYRKNGGSVEAPHLHLRASSGLSMHYLINAVLFNSETGINDKNLFARYIEADTDSNGHLSWAEVKRFQEETYGRFTYRANTFALPPDQFLREGGGDCEDFALYTCGMLRFWGWNCKVGRYYPPDGGYGHAIALVWSARPIDGLGYFRIRQGTYAGGTEVRPGYWIPIDYQIVGGISSAMDADWRLWNLDKPEELYWLNM